MASPDPTKQLVTTSEARAVRPIVPEPDSLAIEELERSQARAILEQERGYVGSLYGIDPATYAALNKFLLRRVPAGDATKLIQDAYLRALQDIGPERLQLVSDPCGYIFRITRNLLIDYFRQRRSDDPLFAGKLVPIDSTNDVRREVYDRRRMERAFGALSLQEQELVLLSLRGYSYNKIAQRVGSSPGEVKRRLIQARVNIGMHLMGRSSAGV